MAVEGGIATIQTIVYDTTMPEYGIPKIGTDASASHGDHVHPLILPMGVYVNSGKPYLESTSTLCYIWTPNNALYWDSVLELFVYI